jgi:hypothetical protein
MSLTKLSLGRNYDVKCKLFLRGESLASDIPVGDGNKLFYGVPLSGGFLFAGRASIKMGMLPGGVVA